MKFKVKQINEMARSIDDNHGFIVSSVETAQAVYNVGYRKIDKDSVVLSRKEYKHYLYLKDLFDLVKNNSLDIVRIPRKKYSRLLSSITRYKNSYLRYRAYYENLLKSINQGGSHE